MSTPEDERTPQQPANDQPNRLQAAEPAVPAAPTESTVPAPPAASDVTVPPAAPGGAFPAAPAAFPAYGGTPAAPAERPAATPTTVTASFWLYIATAALSIVVGIIGIIATAGSRAVVLDQLQRQGGTSLQGQNLDQLADTAVTIGIATLAVTTIVATVLFTLFAFLMRRGGNGARIVLTILTVLSLLNAGSAFGLGLLLVAAAVVAAILMWLPSSNQWFAAIKASRAPRA
ncbi:hypothetical protein [Leifsonia xyli]|nr:hypothetical protein [Leifsonia xyli]